MSNIVVGSCTPIRGVNAYGVEWKRRAPNLMPQYFRKSLVRESADKSIDNTDTFEVEETLP